MRRRPAGGELHNPPSKVRKAATGTFRMDSLLKRRTIRQKKKSDRDENDKRNLYSIHNTKEGEHWECNRLPHKHIKFSLKKTLFLKIDQTPNSVVSKKCLASHISASSNWPIYEIAIFSFMIYSCILKLTILKKYFKIALLCCLYMWAWPATVDTNAPSPDSQYKPTKGLTAGTGRPKWTCAMPVWWIPEESASCITKHWVCCGGGNRADWDRCQTVSWKQCQMGSAGISFKVCGRGTVKREKRVSEGEPVTASVQAEKGKRRWGRFKERSGAQRDKKDTCSSNTEAQRLLGNEQTLLRA